MKTKTIFATAVVWALAGCATGPSGADLDAQAKAAIQASFREQGIAKLDRVQQDLGQSACSSDKPPAEAVAEQITAQAKASVVWPTPRRYRARPPSSPILRSGRAADRCFR